MFSTLQLVTESSQFAALLHPSVCKHCPPFLPHSPFFDSSFCFPSITTCDHHTLLDQYHNSLSFDFSQLLLPIKLIHEFISDQAISLAFALRPTPSNVGPCSSISSSFSKFALDATLCIYPIIRMCSLSSLSVFPLRHVQYSLFLSSYTHVHSSLFHLPPACHWYKS